MNVLETLFSSRPRVEVLRCFLFQPDKELSARHLAERTDVTAGTARKHARELSSIELLRENKSSDQEDGHERMVWKLNKSSQLRDPLHELILMHQDTGLEDVREELSGVGSISLLIVTGVLTGTDSAPVDILLVGDNIDDRQLSRTLNRIETGLGTELRYTLFNEEEFRYRRNVYDKLLQEIIDNDHRVLVDEINAA